jgi:hypothetical protein
VNNYKQALDTLAGELAFQKQMEDQQITSTDTFETWLSEERAYLVGLKREPLQETLQMEYWQKLLNLEASR